MPGLTSILGKRNFYDQNFFSILMFYILLCLVARALYLGIFLARNEFSYSVFSGPLPWVCKALTALFVCKYMLNIVYVAQGKRASHWVRLSILALEISIVVINVAIQSVYCSPDTKHLFIDLNFYAQLTQTIVLITLSWILAAKLSGKMQFGLLKQRRKWVFLLEGFVQVLLVGRLIITVLERMQYKRSLGIVFNLTFIIVLLFTELIPFGFLVYVMSRRFKVYVQAKRNLSGSLKSSEISIEDEHLVYGIDNIDYDKDVKSLLKRG